MSYQMWKEETLGRNRFSTLTVYFISLSYKEAKMDKLKVLLQSNGNQYSGDRPTCLFPVDPSIISPYKRSCWSCGKYVLNFPIFTLILRPYGKFQIWKTSYSSWNFSFWFIFTLPLTGLVKWVFLRKECRLMTNNFLECMCPLWS